VSAQVWAIVVAAGAGQRFGQLKQFAPLGGSTVAAHSVAGCRSCAHGVVLVVPADHVERADFGADIVVAGGATRSESVRCGLAAVPEDAEVIVVHDAARPLAGAHLFGAVVEAITNGVAPAAICATEVFDTIKVVDPARRVTATLDRSTLVAVQTPQAFEAQVLRRAHGGRGEATDDAALVERIGATVVVIPGDTANFKITTTTDLRAAERALEG